MAENRANMIEPLEGRRLLAAGASLSGGTLKVIGGGGADSIEIRLKGSRIEAVVNGNATSFKRAGVGKLLIKGAGGDDFVRVRVANPSDIQGGPGNDHLIGGGGSDTIFGGAGDDILEGSGGDDSLNGGDGHDQLRGGNGADLLDGGAGEDALAGNRGADLSVDLSDRLQDPDKADANASLANFFPIFGTTPLPVFTGGGGNNGILGSGGGSVFGGGNGSVF